MKSKLLIFFLALAFLPLSGNSQNTPTDGSTTITTGGTSQTVFAANNNRRYLEIQNISDTTMYVNFGAAAVADSNSFKLVAGAVYVNASNYCPQGIVTIICATTGKAFVAKQGG